MAEVNFEISQTIAILTNTLEVICSEDCGAETYAVKQKIVDKISDLIDKIDAD